MGFLDRLFGNSSSNKSSNLAKERLQLVLLQDRVKIPPPIMEKMRDEIISVISKYVDIDKDGIEISLTQIEAQNCLTASIPVIRAKEKNR